MRSKIMKIIAYLAIVLMVLSTLPAGALAADDSTQRASGESGTDNGNADDVNDTDDDVNDTDDTDDVDFRASARERIETKRDNIDTRKDIRAQIQSDVAKYRSAKERIVTVRSDYSDAKKDFQELRIKIKNKDTSANSEEVIEATRAYMNRTIEYMITHLETVQENVDNSDRESADEVSETIDGYIEQLQQQHDNLESAQTRQEFAEIAKEVRSIWKDAEKRAKYFAGKSVDKRLDNYLAKSDALALRIKGEIDRLNETGENVEDLEEMLGEYNELIEEAKLNQELAREAIRNRNVDDDDDDSVDDANKYMREATRNIQEANKVLKEIFDELKSHRRGGSVSLDGAGTLTTEGSGTAVFSGNLTIDINATDAKLVIKDLAGDAEIIITGDYTKVNDDDDDEDEEDDDDNRALVYHDFTGTAHITGSRLTVMVHGDDLSITAEGEGSSILSGRGSYNVEKAGVSSDEMKWAGDDDDDENEVDDSDGESDDAEDDVDDSDDVDDDESDTEDDSDDADDGESDDEDDSDDSDSDDTQDNSTADGNETEDIGMM